jgi:phosphoenolpyruvate-protein phosphotransferase
MNNPLITRGISVGHGIAIGPVFLYSPKRIEVEQTQTDNPKLDLKRLIEAIKLSTAEIEDLRKASLRQIGEKDAAIFDAHKLILNDPDLLEKVTRYIHGDNFSAEYAWNKAIEEYAELYRSLNSSTMVERSADVQDVGARVLRKLSKDYEPGIHPKTPSVLLCDELSPSDTASIHPDTILGIICTKGSRTSHSAIIARSLGIPAVFGIGGVAKDYQHSENVVVDGTSGDVYFECSDALIAEMSKKQNEWQKKRSLSQKNKLEQATTACSKTIRVLGNVSSAEEVKTALENGAEGIGLFRTEFLYMNRIAPPSEEEQYEEYRRAVELANGNRVTFRTLDIGGDKAISYLDIDKESNPFLGVRGIRYSLRFPKVFAVQLRAIMRASKSGLVSIMFPMISTLQEWHAALKILGEVIQDLDDEGVEVAPDVSVGIMIETPASVMNIRDFLKEVDFVSIGTNDLAQYVMATDRNNPQIGSLATTYQPAVLKMIKRTISAARDVAKPVAMCGEMASDPEVTALLLGYGLRNFSMNSSQIPDFKQNLRTITMESAKKLPDKVKGYMTPAQVKDAIT